jgi:hypothetical protein
VPMYGWFATAATRSPTGADRIGARDARGLGT